MQYLKLTKLLFSNHSATEMSEPKDEIPMVFSFGSDKTRMDRFVYFTSTNEKKKKKKRICSCDEIYIVLLKL